MCFCRDEANMNAKELSDLAEREVKLEEELHELGDVHALTKHCKDEIEADLAKTSQILAEAEGRLAAAEVSCAPSNSSKDAAAT